MRRALPIAVAAALAGAASATAALPVHSSGSVIGEGLPLKAYASLTPTVQLFGDTVTARLAVVADTKWVQPQRLHVQATFDPYVPVHRPQLLSLRSGRYEQLTWTWQLRCLATDCVPRAPPSDLSQVFSFPPARIDYVPAAGGRRYGIEAAWPSVEVISQVSPAASQLLLLTKRIPWRAHLTPMAAPTYRIPPGLLIWLALVLAGVLSLAAVGLVGRWYLTIRPRAMHARADPGTPLERALAVLRFAHEAGDETLQRKAFERAAGELGVERAGELAAVARELAWSPRTPEDQEIEDFAVQALDAPKEEA